MNKLILAILFLFIAPSYADAGDVGLSFIKNSNDSINKKKLNKYIIISSVTYGAGLVALDRVWYSGHERESFHFFNDNKEWKQLDKFGHFYSAYQIGHIGIKALQSTGLNKKKAYFWGGMMGAITLTPIEILDGFSSEYGASWGDIVANISGSLMITGQYLLWDDVKIHAKYSFYPNAIARERPEVLGKAWHEEIIKNYNGMTYWLSFDLYGLMGEENKFPKWLNIAIGYGADEMISGSDVTSQQMGYDPYRQYFLGIDIDLTYIKTNNKWVKSLVYLANMIRLPAPALEYNRKKGLVFHPIFF